MFWNAEDGYYVLNEVGYAVLAAVAVIILIMIAVLKGRKKDQKPTAKTRVTTLTFTGVSIALAFVLSYVRIWKMPWGGDITLLSMFFVTFVGYLFGAGTGFAAAFVYSILQFIQSGGTYMLTPFQVCCDYFLAFTALGASGFFRNKKNGLIIGYIVAVFLRGVFHTVGGYLYWMDYMPENFPASLAVIYPIAYNYSYLIAEAVITLVVILLPPVKKGLNRIKTMAGD